MSVAEIRNAIMGKVNTVEDKKLLEYFYEIINSKQNSVLDATMQKQLDKILSEDHNLLHRLAQ
jgi:hypothetical protein